MSRLLWHNVTLNKKPHRAAVLWAYDSRSGKHVIRNVRVFHDLPSGRTRERKHLGLTAMTNIIDQLSHDDGNEDHSSNEPNTHR